MSTSGSNTAFANAAAAASAAAAAAGAPLTLRELLASIQEFLGTRVSDEDFSRPAMIAHLFQTLLLNLKGISFERVKNNALAATQEYTNIPNAYNHISVQLTFVRYVYGSSKTLFF